MTETRTTTRSFETWLENHEEELWIEFHETGANYDTDYEWFLEQRYELSLRHASPVRKARGDA